MTVIIPTLKRHSRSRGRKVMVMMNRRKKTTLIQVVVSLG